MADESELEAAVNQLYDFRDHYFEKNSIEKAIDKPTDLGDEMKRTLTLLDTAQDSCVDKAKYLMLRGKALNVMPHFSEEAMENLSKSVKLDPKLVEAWNQLGECYWKNKDIKAAKNCFNGALTHSNNKVSLRNLSMVLRQLDGTAEEKEENLKLSINYAKQAIQLDITDGTSWFIMGNSYLSAYFAGGQSPGIIKQCLSAYSQAEKDVVANSNPDLHYNRAVAFRYQEEYELALLGLTQASKLDPTWPDPKEKKAHLTQYLEKLNQLVAHKGKLKAKKLNSFVQSISEKELSQYGGGSYSIPSGNTVKLDYVTFSQLNVGPNPQKVVLGKVVCSVTSDEPTPFTFAMVDSMATCYAVTVYNIAVGCGVIIGDSVAVPEPFIVEVKIRLESGDEVKFQSIRVDSPIVMIVNGKKWSLDKQAPAVLSVSAKSE